MSAFGINLNVNTLSLSRLHTNKSYIQRIHINLLFSKRRRKVQYLLVVQMTDFCLKKYVEPLKRISILFDKKNISALVSTGTFYIIQRKYIKVIVCIIVNMLGQYAFANEIHIVLSSLLKYVQSKYYFPTPAKQYNEHIRCRYSFFILIYRSHEVYIIFKGVRFCVPVSAFFTHRY